MTQDDGHLMFVFANPTAGREDEFNEWYNREHLPAIVGLDGVLAGQRFVFDSEQPPRGFTPPFRYLALYEVAPGGIVTVRASLDHVRQDAEEAGRTGRPPRVQHSSSMADPWGVFWMTALTPRITKPGE